MVPNPASKRRPEQITVTRFAPSPTGYLHLGHAYAALVADAAAKAAKGTFLLRIEDIDTGRCRPEFEHAIAEDLDWLGLSWEEPARRQSDHMDDYQAAISALTRKGLLYPCFCTRADIKAEIGRADSAPNGLMGPDGPVYPGTCRSLSERERTRRIEASEAHALRLDMPGAVSIAGPLRWNDAARGAIKADPGIFGDVVLARKDTPTSYHLAVTVDDHLQGVSLVTRGTDLFPATHIHRLLQALLGYQTPDYAHHRLLTDETGKRLAKSAQSTTIRALREDGASADEVRALTGFEG